MFFLIVTRDVQSCVIKKMAMAHKRAFLGRPTCSKHVHTCIYIAPDTYTYILFAAATPWLFSRQVFRDTST